MGKFYQQLLERVKAGEKLPKAEIASIRRQLETEIFEDDPYTLLHIIGKAGDLSSASLVWNYLNYDTGNPEQDDMVRRIALQVVGRMWALPEAFDIALSKAFEDPSPYVRAAAARIIGFLGSRYREFAPRSASALLRGLEQNELLDEHTWESFYYGLLELLNVPATEWPTPTKPLNSAQIRKDLVEKARRMAAMGNKGERGSNLNI